MYRKGEFVVKKSRRGWVIVNEDGEYENHSHFTYSYGATIKCIELTRKKKVPRSEYMIIACKRLTNDVNYIERLDRALELAEARKQKGYYININKGAKEQ